MSCIWNLGVTTSHKRKDIGYYNGLEGGWLLVDSFPGSCRDGDIIFKVLNRCLSITFLTNETKCVHSGSRAPPQTSD